MRLARVIAFLIERTGLRALLQQLWRRDIARSIAASDRHTAKALTQQRKLIAERRKARSAVVGTIRRLEQRLAESEAAVAGLERRLEQLERRPSVGEGPPRHLVDWRARVSPAAVCDHVTRTVAAARLCERPAAHLVVEDLFPADFYDVLIEALPGGECFSQPGRQDERRDPDGITVIPRLAGTVWELVEADVARALGAAALDRLRPFIAARYAALLGADRAQTFLALPHESSPGRLVLRCPGNAEAPHLDPKRLAVTVLVYLAKPGDQETGGTGLYAIAGDFAPVQTGTAYPERHGLACTLVSRIPYRANSALVLVNGGAAHAVEAPEEGAPPRYTFEFGIGPDAFRLIEQVAALPPPAQQQWLGLAELRTR